MSVNFYPTILKLLEDQSRFAVATVVRSPGGSRVRIGVKMLIFPDGSIKYTIGGGAFEARVVEVAREALAKGKSRVVTCGLDSGAAQSSSDIATVSTEKTADIFIEVFEAPPTLLVLGAGHIALPVVKMGKDLGFRVVVVDSRPKFATPERFPQADQVVLSDPGEVLKSMGLTPSTYAVILTHDYRLDQAALRVLLPSPVAYIGLLGSRRKAKVIFDNLRQEGVQEELLSRVYAPIGLDIGAQTPEEIAVSILAEILSVKYGKSGYSLSGTK